MTTQHPPGDEGADDHNPLAELIGPFYNTEGVGALLGELSASAVDARRDAHELLGVKTSDGVWIYPVFQFEGPTVHPTLARAIKALADSPPWSTALWFVTRNTELEDKTPLEWARQRGDAEALMRSAKATNNDFR